MSNKIKVIAALAALIMLFSACSGTEEVNVAALTEDCITLRGITDWQTAAAAYLMSIDISELVINKPETGDGISDVAESVLFDLFVYDTASSSDIASLKQYIESKPESLTTVEMALCTYALEVSGTEYDCTKAASELVSRQQNDGGFGRAHDYAASEATPSAYALDLVLFWREYVSDTCYDGILVYFYKNMTDENVWEDESGDTSCVVTSIVLNGFIHAGIRFDGDDAQAIAKSIRVLYGIEDKHGSILGFREYTSADTAASDACGYALLALATSQTGSLWDKIEITKG